MQLKNTLVRAALGLYFIQLFFQIYILKPNLILTFGPLDAAFFAFAVAVSVYFAVSPHSIVAPILLWCWIFVFDRMNPLAKEIYFDYMGWMLIYFAVHAIAEKYRIGEELFYRVAILTFGTSYTASGLLKCLSSEWLNGRILSFVRLQGFFLSWTEPVVNAAILVEFSWVARITTCLEVLALPMVMFPPTRLAIWILLTIMQIGLLLTTSINHISALMLIFHALCFDPAWLPRRAKA